MILSGLRDHCQSKQTTPTESYLVKNSFREMLMMHTLNAMANTEAVYCFETYCLAEFMCTFPLSFVKAECQDVHTNDQR